MNSKIYVGNLNFATTNDDLTEAFSKYGTVRSAKIVTDRDTNRSKGFAFVEMGTSLEAENAIMRLNGTELEGRSMNVSIAKPKTNDSRPRY